MNHITASDEDASSLETGNVSTHGGPHQPDSPRPLLTASLPFGALTLASVIAILVVPEVESGRIFLSGFFAIFSTLVLYRALDKGVQRGNVSRRLAAPGLILNLIASGVLGYLAGSALMGLHT